MRRSILVTRVSWYGEVVNDMVKQKLTMSGKAIACLAPVYFWRWAGAQAVECSKQR